MIKISGIKLYEIKEVSELLGVKLRTMRGYVYKGRIKFQKISRKVYISEDSLKEFLQGSFYEKKKRKRK